MKDFVLSVLGFLAFVAASGYVISRLEEKESPSRFYGKGGESW